MSIGCRERIIYRCILNYCVPMVGESFIAIAKCPDFGIYPNTGIDACGEPMEMNALQCGRR